MASYGIIIGYSIQYHSFGRHPKKIYTRKIMSKGTLNGHSASTRLQVN